MSDTTRKVIILNKLSSPFISEAIIILEDGVTLPQSRIVSEAEKIVCTYMERSAKSGRAPKRAARLCQYKTAAFLCFVTALIVFSGCYFLLQ